MCRVNAVSLDRLLGLAAGLEKRKQITSSPKAYLESTSARMAQGWLLNFAARHAVGGIAQGVT
jgi:hypothetical protein